MPFTFAHVPTEYIRIYFIFFIHFYVSACACMGMNMKMMAETKVSQQKIFTHIKRRNIYIRWNRAALAMYWWCIDGCRECWNGAGILTKPHEILLANGRCLREEAEDVCADCVSGICGDFVIHSFVCMNFEVKMNRSQNQWQRGARWKIDSWLMAGCRRSTEKHLNVPWCYVVYFRCMFYG